MKKIILIIATIVASLNMLADNRPQSVGLVLSGGGAKGIAHIGVIQALEDNDIPIDYITGTSMGSIVGGLYAAGYTPAEMIELIASPGFSDWSTGKIAPDLTYYLLQPAETPAMLNLNLGLNDSSKVTSRLPTSLINPLPMNFAFMELFTPFTQQCDENFDNLFVPFRCVTSDVFAKHKIVLKDGDLGDAIRMSMSFPMVFEPIDRDGLPMYDGGIYDNFPVDVMMTEFAPAAVIGVDVSTPNSPTTRNMLDQLENMIMQPDNYPFPHDIGVYIHIDLTEFSLLDFPKYKEIYDIGYARGLEMIDSIKMKIHARVPKLTRDIRRDIFKSHTPVVEFDKVKVSGGKPSQNVYLESLFRRRHETDTFGIAFAKEAYYRAITPGRLLNFVPTPEFDKADSLYSLNFKALVKDNFSLGLGGYISSSTNSMLFLTGSYNTLSFNSLNAGVNLWVGQSYIAALGNLKLLFPTVTPTAWSFEIEASQQKFSESERLFFEFGSPNFVTKSEVFARTYYSIATSRRNILDIGVAAGHLRDRFYARDELGMSLPEYAFSTFNLGEFYATWRRNTLDNRFAPTRGTNVEASLSYLVGSKEFKTDGDVLPSSSGHIQWFQASVDAEKFFPLTRKFSTGLRLKGIFSTKGLLDNYDATIVSANAFNPTVASYDAFNPALRANSYVAAGIDPVWKISSVFQLRGTFDCFLPYKRIELEEGTIRPRWSKVFAHPEYVGEVSGVVTLPFGNIRVYTQYSTGGGERWNAGISIGTFMLAPRFVK
ncbi:MAG: patatin [Barnesiella sp.]|nr:patatin [Barnesiella sp.]MBD5343874.1 patatin [Bacteroides sp.]